MLNLSSTAETIIACGPEAPEKQKARLKDKGAHLLELPLFEGRIDLYALMTALGARGITSLLVEGGAQVAGAVLKAGIVDKVHFFYAPKILGGGDGIPMCNGKGPEKMSECLPLLRPTVSRAGDDILVTGYLSQRSPA